MARERSPSASGLPRAGPIEMRLPRIVELHDHVRRIFSDYLDSDTGYDAPTSRPSADPASRT
jgi:hypothetical protein